MKDQSRISTYQSDLVAMNSLQGGTKEHRESTKVPSRLPYIVELPSRNGTTSNPDMSYRQYSTVDRKFRAQAFADRCNNLKYYIGLIRLDVFT